MKSFMLLLLLLLSLDSIAGSVMVIGSSTPYMSAKLKRIHYDIDRTSINIIANGRNSRNQNVSCVIKFPIAMKDFAFDLYKFAYSKRNKNNR